MSAVKSKARNTFVRCVIRWGRRCRISSSSWAGTPSSSSLLRDARLAACLGRRHAVVPVLEHQCPASRVLERAISWAPGKLLGIFCSHQLGLRKPNPAAFEQVVQRIGIAPSRLAFFDDAPENVHGAREAGLLGFHVTSMTELRQALINDLRLSVAR